MKAPRVCSALLVFAAVLAGAVQPAIAFGPKPGEPWENSLGMKFVPVPGTHVLFCIWETRVQDFEAFVKATSYDAGEGWRAPGATGQSHVAGFSQTPLHPVVNVNWNDAEAFCRWLTEKERAAGNLSAGQEFRLPTDAEWSQAVGLPAESGATPQEKNWKIENVYPWGAGHPPPKGSRNYSGEGDGWAGKIDGYTDGAKFTAKVGSYTANRLGIYDLGGNVWEWCSDWFNAEQKERAVRGASFNQGAPGVLLSSHHTRQRPGTREFNLGFRCVVTVGAPSLSAAEPRTVPGLGLTLMPIPAGTFTMGRPGRNETDRPPTRVTISQPFWLGRTEVTQGQWKALMGTDVVEQVRRQLAEDRLAGKQLSRRDGVDRTNVSDPNELVYNTDDDAPMYWVSWEEAVAFCRRLTERERAEGRLPAGYEYRLPTDAEWEYAACAGTTTATYAGELEIKAFTNAPVLDRIAWYRGNSSEGYTGKDVDTSARQEKKYPAGIAGPHTVATKLPNAWGLHDMLGNVWEWCGDWYAYQLPGGSVSDPTGPAVRNTVQQAAYVAAGGNLTHETSTGAGRVIRGGSWPAAPHVVNAVGRIWQQPGQRESALGFRPALAPEVSR